MVMFHKVALINKNQRGFTLVEILLAMLIMGFVAVGITATIFQLFIGSDRNSSHMTAVRQVENAGYWISHDAQMAQDVYIASGSFLKLNWIDSADVSHEVIYNLEDNELKRNYYIGGSPEQTDIIIARFIESASCVPSELGLVFEVTATVQEQTETRTYEIIPRPG